MSTRERLTLAAALAVALGCAAVGPLYDGRGWVLRALGAIAVVAATGLACRRGSVPLALQPLLAVVALLEYVCLVFARLTLAYGLVPTGKTVAALRALLVDGADDISRLAPPVPSTPGLVLIAVLGVGAVALVVDLVAVVAGRAALAGLPLLVLFAVPSAVRTGGVGWLPFAVGAAGWLSLLLVEGGERVSRWGTPLKSDRPTYEDATLGRVGRRIGAAALGVAVVVPAMIPGLDGRLLGGDGGDGGGTGAARTTTTYNPITRLRNDLRLPDPRTVLTYTTNDPTPDYLRLTTLDLFADAGWSASRLTGSSKDNSVKSTLPAPVGLSRGDVEVQPVRDTITIKDLDARWLPTPFPPREVKVKGPWLYDRRSETIFGIRTGTRDLAKSYTVEATRVVPDGELLDSLASPYLPIEVQPYADVPVVTPTVAAITAKVIAGQKTPYGKVAAIQRYFRSPSFSYSTSSKVAGIDSQSDLENFLVGKTGFCEQYASAMAAMIRLAKVPARVGVGFTAGTKAKDGRYVVTTSDAHAWPEAWFAGAGWVRFEPTPRTDGRATVPEYASAEAIGGPAEDGPAGPDPELGPTADNPNDGGLSDKLNNVDAVPPTSSGTGAEADEPASAGLPVGLLALVALLLLAALPWLLHGVRSRRRWGTAGPLVAWSQVCDDAVDAGHRWRAADSPRAAAEHLTLTRGIAGAPRESLERIALAAERARYARDGGGADAALRADAARVREALLAGLSPRARWRARLLPPSTLRWATSSGGTLVADGLDRFDDGWASMRRRLRMRPAS
ncbi:MAG: transglutaminaseTgpA domain-containing protein [Mycobacteriales bacterium]